MILTDEQREEFTEKTELLIKWLNDNTDPHYSIEITTTSAELKNGKLYHRTNEFIRD